MTALKDALVKVFWRKDHLRKVLVNCGVSKALISQQDWNAYKFHIVDPILDRLNNTVGGSLVIERLITETLGYTDCSHLLRYPDGKDKKKEAEASVQHLREMTGKPDPHKTGEDDEQASRKKAVDKHKAKQTFNKRLTELKERFTKFYQMTDARRRGFELEKFLFELFELFELQPRGAFKLTGEQIDGALIHESTDFLIEAKWQNQPVKLDDLRDLDAAVKSKLENTLGLFLSINGFTDEALKGYCLGSRPQLICMDGIDLMAVLDGQIDLAELIRRKRSIASQRGRVYVTAKEILLGRC